MKKGEVVQGSIEVTQESMRTQILRFISAIGFMLIAAGSLDINGIRPFLPDELGEWLVPIGAGMAGLKQILLILGDFFDDYKLNKSFKFPLALLPFLFLTGLLIGISFTAVSCGNLTATGLSVSPDGGLIFKRQSEDGSEYIVFFTPSPPESDDPFESVWAVWENADGVELEATYVFQTKQRSIRYRENPESGWLVWSSKSGISLDGIPDEVQIQGD